MLSFLFPLFIGMPFSFVYAFEGAGGPGGYVPPAARVAPQSATPGYVPPDPDGAGVSQPGMGQRSTFRAPQEGFVPLVGIPGFTDLPNPGIDGLLQALYRLAVAGGALLAVLVITFAGFKYMATDSIGSKEEARSDIKNALLGLLIILSTALILRTIFGEVNFDIFRYAPSLSMPVTRPLDPRIGGDPNPVAVIDRTAGCNQTTAPGAIAASVRSVQCNDGKIPALEQGQVTCVTPEAIQPYPGQTTFGPLTQNQCASIQRNYRGVGGNPAAIIGDARGNGTIFGYGTVLRTEIANEEVRGRLDRECKESSGGRGVITNVIAYPPRGGLASGTLMGVLCGTPLSGQ